MKRDNKKGRSQRLGKWVRPALVQGYKYAATITRKHWKKVSLGVLVFIGVPSFVTVMISDTYDDFLAAHFSQQHKIVVMPVFFGPVAYPSCSIAEFSIVPRAGIKELNLNLTFDEEVRSTLIRQVPLSDYSGKHGNELNGNVSLKAPCDFDNETPASDNGTLSLSLSSDRTTVFIKAHDLIPEESREVVLLFYPDYAIERRFPKWHQRTTYTAYGREIPACFVWQELVARFEDLDPGPHFPVMGTFECAPSDGESYVLR
jgi:hypothetical protein